MSTIIDSYSETNLTGSAGESTSARLTRGQSFTGNSSTLVSCKFYLHIASGTTGTLYAHLYSHTGTYGVDGTPDTLLATSNAIDMTTIGTVGGLVEFTFSGSEQYDMGSTYYFITMSGTITGTLYFGTDNSSPTHSGNYWTSYGANASFDGIFYVYGEPITTPTVGTKYPLPAFKVA